MDLVVLDTLKKDGQSFEGCIPVNEHSHGTSTILMVFPRKHGDFHGLCHVSFREGSQTCILSEPLWVTISGTIALTWEIPMQVLMAMDGNTSCNTRILHEFLMMGIIWMNISMQQLKDDGFPWGFFDPKKPCKSPSS